MDKLKYVFISLGCDLKDFVVIYLFLIIITVFGRIPIFMSETDWLPCKFVNLNKENLC